MKLHYIYVLLALFTRDFVFAKLKCQKGKSTTRRFTLHVEMYSTMGPACKTCPNDLLACFTDQCVTADGISRGIITVNRQMPGPTIEVCKYDKVKIEVYNHLIGSELSIHWHGQLMKGTQYDDGVSMVTQCPISEGTSWEYNFIAQEDGTFFYHSHSGFQKMNGCFGGFIVQNPEDPHKSLYDFDEHILVVQDWFHGLTENYIPGPVKFDIRGQIPHNLLMNGRGQYINVNGVNTGIPLSVLKVERGKRYRLRIIHAGCLECILQLQIQNHDMMVIATDGFPIKPAMINTLVLAPGERYDVVLHATQAVGTYIIQLVGLGECEKLGTHQQALLCYKGDSCVNPPKKFELLKLPKGIILNPLAAACTKDTTGICVYQLQALKEHNQCGSSKDDESEKFLITFNFYNYNYDELFEGGNNQIHRPFYIPKDGTENTYFMQGGQMNNISMMLPSFPPLSQPKDLKDILNRSPFKCDDDRTKHQNCLHLLHVKLGATVDMVLVHDSINEKTEAHPIHIHGYKFCVLYQGYSLEEARKCDLSSKGSVMKDTVAVPGSGITRIRFIADNPGVWLAHCHIIMHQITGMQLIILVGDPDDLPPVPRHFPKCGDFEY